MARQIRLILHDLRSTHNVGALFRTADGLGVEYLYLTGYTAYPAKADDKRLPHLAAKADRQIDKTALGAQKTVPWRQSSKPLKIIQQLKADGFKLVALEQTAAATSLPDFSASAKTALLVGSEMTGLPPRLLALSDAQVQIPMFGAKESFNVAVAGAMALYHIRYNS